MKRRNKIMQEITRNVANVFRFYAIIAIEHVFFQCINIRQVHREVLKTAATNRKIFELENYLPCAMVKSA